MSFVCEEKDALFVADIVEVGGNTAAILRKSSRRPRRPRGGPRWTAYFAPKAASGSSSNNGNGNGNGSPAPGSPPQLRPPDPELSRLRPSVRLRALSPAWLWPNRADEWLWLVRVRLSCVRSPALTRPGTRPLGAGVHHTNPPFFGQQSPAPSGIDEETTGVYMMACFTSRQRRVTDTELWTPVFNKFKNEQPAGLLLRNKF
ncbi:hypothetical protein PG988_015986 [Apiospora saccharicola]